MADERRLASVFRLPRRHPDPVLSDDPRVVSVLDGLAAVRDDAVAPRAEFRSDLRAQLVAITPRIVAESAAEHAPAVGTEGRFAPKGVVVVDRPRPAPRSGAPAAPRRSLAAVRRIPLARPLAVAASVIVVLALVLGGAVWMSRDAVPGDTLYGLKRTSENVRLSFAGSDADRAADHLEFAQTRVGEARTLLGRTSALGAGPLAAGRISDETATLVTRALASADSDTRQATSLLGTAAVDSASPRPLDGLSSWAPAQLRRLADLRAAAPDNAEVDAATAHSATLVETARSRATALARRVHCNCLRGGPSDAFGPLPVPATKVPAVPSTTTPGTTTTPTRPSGSSAPGTGSGARPSTAPSRQTAPPASSDTPGRSLPSLRLPSRLPSRLPTLPTTKPSLGDLCKVNVLGIRVCPSTSN